jgi:hypothetical protein
VAALAFQKIEYLDEVALERVGTALAVLQVILAEIPVERAGVRDREISVDPVSCQPRVQVPGRVALDGDRFFLVRAVVPVVHCPEVALEFGERRLPVAQHRAPSRGLGRAGMLGAHASTAASARYLEQARNRYPDRDPASSRTGEHQPV